MGHANGMDEYTLGKRNSRNNDRLSRPDGTNLRTTFEAAPLLGGADRSLHRIRMRRWWQFTVHERLSNQRDEREWHMQRR
jgi:hypothetical protein